MTADIIDLQQYRDKRARQHINHDDQSISKHNNSEHNSRFGQRFRDMLAKSNNRQHDNIDIVKLLQDKQVESDLRAHEAQVSRLVQAPAVAVDRFNPLDKDATIINTLVHNYRRSMLDKSYAAFPERAYVVRYRDTLQDAVVVKDANTLRELVVVIYHRALWFAYTPSESN